MAKNDKLDDLTKANMDAKAPSPTTGPQGTGANTNPDVYRVPDSEQGPLTGASSEVKKSLDVIKDEKARRTKVHGQKDPDGETRAVYEVLHGTLRASVNGTATDVAKGEHIELSKAEASGLVANGTLKAVHEAPAEGTEGSDDTNKPAV